MSRDKDFRLLIEAARRLHLASPDEWRFVLVGDGPDRSDLTALASDLVSTGVVEFRNPGTEVLSIVRDSDIGVLLTDAGSHAEGVSNSIIEYMACGLPVVCSDSGGNRELVVEGETGFILPSGDAAALVDALTQLRGDPQTATRMGNAGRGRIETEFSVERMVAETLQAYRRAANGRLDHVLAAGSQDAA